ncbi:hypothetical protein Tco_0996768, partial [Tanacetum coccineum]
MYPSSANTDTSILIRPLRALVALVFYRLINHPSDITITAEFFVTVKQKISDF